MHTPDYEGKACDAVLKFLEKWTGKSRTDTRRPEQDRVGPPVDLRLRLGAQDYAIEHTRIESFKNQIEAGIDFRQINDYLKGRITDPLPGPAYYELQVPINICLTGKRKKRAQVLRALVKWIHASAHCMHERNTDLFAPVRSPVWHEDCITGTVPGLGFEIKLLRSSLFPPAFHTVGRKPGSFVMWYIYLSDDEMNELRFKRLRRALETKCPKLNQCKNEGARTVLILEIIDSSFTRFTDIGRHLPALLAERTDTPDEIYIVQPGASLWWVLPIKRDGVHWPTNMPVPGQSFYEEDKLPTVGMPEGYIKALGLDELYKPHPRGWVPITFEEEELDDMMLGCSTKKFVVVEG